MGSKTETGSENCKSLASGATKRYQKARKGSATRYSGSGRRFLQKAIRVESNPDPGGCAKTLKAPAFHADQLLNAIDFVSPPAIAARIALYGAGSRICSLPKRNRTSFSRISRGCISSVTISSAGGRDGSTRA